MSNRTIVAMPGDGIGKVVLDEAIRVLEKAGFNANYIEDLNFPGQYPYTRGIHSNLYRGKLWTMRQFAGFGTPEETNKRFKFLLKEGQTGLSVAFDMPTLMGYDADHSMSSGEVGHCGVSISSIKDMERLFDGINLADVSISMTINGLVVFNFGSAVRYKFTFIVIYFVYFFYLLNIDKLIISQVKSAWSYENGRNPVTV